MTAFTMGPAILFCPADRPDRYAKALERADAVIIDLEDAVAPGNRAAARAALIEHPQDPERTIVRVNPVGSPDFAADLAALGSTQYRTVMLAKTESAADADALGDYSVVALCETALGVLNAAQIAAAPNVAALMWGAEDLIASLGGSSSRTEVGQLPGCGTPRPFAGAARRRGARQGRHRLGVPGHRGPCGAAGRVARRPGLGLRSQGLDPPRADASHPTGLHAHPRAGRARGGILAAAEKEPGVFAFEGQMVDEPLLRHARMIISQGRRHHVSGLAVTVGHGIQRSRCPAVTAFTGSVQGRCLDRKTGAINSQGLSPLVKAMTDH